MKIFEVTANISQIGKKPKGYRIYIFGESASEAHIAVKHAINANKDMFCAIIRVKEIKPRRDIIFAMTLN